MGRPLRIEYHGALYHIISRGNERRSIFLDNADRFKFLAILKDYHERYNILIHSFVLMDNHYHLLLETTQPNLARIVYAGFILGKTSFIKEKLEYLKEEVESMAFSFRGELTRPIGVSEIMGIITKKYNKDMADLRKLKNHPAKEKKVAIYLLKRYSNLSNAEIGEHFGLSYSSVSKAAGSLEKQMDKDKGLKKEIDGIISHFKG